MKKIRQTLIFIFASVFVISAQSRIAILPFSAGENVIKSDMAYMTEEFTLAMVSSGKYTVLERVQLDKAMKELQLQNSDDFDESQAAEIGKLAGAEHVFVGSVYRIAGLYNVSVRCVDIQTGAITFAKKGETTDARALAAICKKIAFQIVCGDTTSSTVKIELTVRERKVKENYLDYKWNISATNKEEMSYYFKRNIAGGAALAAIGGTFLISGIVVTSLFFLAPFNFFSGPVVLVGGVIITPICALPFAVAKHIRSIYEKSTGEKLMSFLQRTSVGGGYNWENKEVTVAMAIRL